MDGGGPTYFISPTGSDTQPGSRALPWSTWSHAMARLAPGATLVALDGSYSDTSQNPLAIDCTPASTACAGGPCPNGAPGRPITLRAEHERLARVPSGARSGLAIKGCAHWEVEGLRFDQSDGNGEGELSVVRIEAADQVVLRRLLVIHPDRSKNSHGILISHSRDVLLVETEVYEFHRYGILVTGGERVTLRRNYVNSRSLPDLAGYASEYPATGDSAIVLGGTLDAIAENNFAEDVHTGIEVFALAFPAPVPGGGDRNRLLGNVVRGATVGFYARSSCGNQPNCDPSLLTVSDLQIRDCVAIGTEKGFALGGVENALLNNLTSSSASEVDFHFYRLPENSGMTSSVVLRNSLNFGPGKIGVLVEQQGTWSVDHCNSHGNASNYLPTAGPTASSALDPLMGGCLLYLPAGSPMVGAGTEGGDIGASVRFALENGELTSRRLWAAPDGHFLGCGALVDGNGPGAGKVCRNLHERLNVGVGGCALPP